MHTNIVSPTDDSEFTGKTVGHGICLGQMDQRQIYCTHGIAAFPKGHGRLGNDRGHGGTVQSARAEAYRQNP